MNPRLHERNAHATRSRKVARRTRSSSDEPRQAEDVSAEDVGSPAAAETDRQREQVPLHHLPTEDLRKELQRRHVTLRRLIVRRGRLMRQLRDVESQITKLGGEAALHGEAQVANGPRRKRARNPVSLPDAIAGVVEVRATVTPAEAAKLVLEAGYRSTSKNFGMMVANALAKDARFKRIARGRYERIA